jgi:hypothetical protein
MFIHREKLMNPDCGLCVDDTVGFRPRPSPAN